MPETLATKMRCRRMPKIRGREILFIFFLGLIFILMYGKVDEPFLPDYPPSSLGHVDTSCYIQKFPHHKHWKGQHQKKILFWTPFFGGWGWQDDAIWEFSNNCNVSCVATKDRKELSTSDAVLFHENDLWFTKGVITSIYQSMITMPSYRTPNQVWVLYSIEPIIYSWGIVPPGALFNWTMFYRHDSTVPVPYGKMIKMSKEEIKNNQKEDRDYAKEKTGLAVTLVSNCMDDLKRYRIVNELQKYITVETYGSCFGKKICMKEKKGPECIKSILQPYKFYLAFENSICRDYISEKFWNAIRRDQIPVTAYPFDLTDIVPPGSYLNLFDFPSIKHLAEKMIEIDKNDTLYNSFFMWKKFYKPDSTGNYCKLCQKLHADYPPQVYHDMGKWMNDDSCQSSTTTTLIQRFLDRQLFNLGF